MVSVHPALDHDAAFAVLERVMDPEVPVLSVVELGIVRDVRVDDRTVTVVITPTYSGCPAMHAIEADITSALRAAGAADVRIETIYAPAWTTDWMSDDAKEKLRAYGIAPPARTETGEELIPLMRRAAAVRCPYCSSTATEVRSEFGSTACKSIWVCHGCEQPFEQFKAI
jgi:ring-1,2-phenylacetyl-CoA epoxidase subunit PaaD